MRVYSADMHMVKNPWDLSTSFLHPINCWRLCIVLSVLSLSTLHNVTAQGTHPLQVIISTQTFTPEKRPVFQAYANLVANEVNALIPGLPADTTNPRVICFEETADFSKALNSEGPITIHGPKVPGEPEETKANTLRIAVSGVQPLFMRRFVYQLAHELAHIKMGVSIDNMLFETFATAVSFEVLRRMNLYDYLIPTTQTMIRELHPAVQAQLAAGDFSSLRTAYQLEATERWFFGQDRPMQTLGALLMQAGGEPNWHLLLGVSALTNCDPGWPADVTVKACRPDIKAMKAIGLSLTSLGY